MRNSLDYAGLAQLCARSPIMRKIMRAHNRIIQPSLEKAVSPIRRRVRGTTRSPDDEARNAVHAGTSATHVTKSAIHRMKWRHRIYGHDTIAILWVQHGIMCGVKGRRFIVFFKQHSIRWFLKMSVWSVTSQWKTFIRVYPQDGGESRWRWNYVTVTICVYSTLCVVHEKNPYGKHSRKTSEVTYLSVCLLLQFLNSHLMSMCKLWGVC